MGVTVINPLNIPLRLTELALDISGGTAHSLHGGYNREVISDIVLMPLAFKTVRRNMSVK
jgi:hypothetical protein